MPKATKRGWAEASAHPGMGMSVADLNPEEVGPHAKSEYLHNWSQRHDVAEGVNKQINRMAFPGVGDDPGVIETMAGEDPEAVGFSAPGGLGPHHMLNAAQTLRKWEIPDLPPGQKEGFGSSVSTNLAEGNIKSAGNKAGTPHVAAWLDKLGARQPDLVADPLGTITAHRRDSIASSLASGDPDAAWYQGKAQALIHNAAMEHGVSVPLMRKTTAASSPRAKWDHTYVDNPKNRKEGTAGTTVFPNITDAGRVVEASKGRTPDEAAEEVVARGIPGVQRGPAARIAASMMQGTMHGSDPIPKTGESEKIDTFEVNLSDPTHEKYGYSAWAERHQLSGHTADVQDARAGGYHEEDMAVPRPPALDDAGVQRRDKKDRLVYKGKPIHEEMLETPAGADIAQSTALVARTEAFSAGRAEHGEGWAKENAKSFLAGPSQSMQWSVARESGSGSVGTVGIPEHILTAYANRPKPTGFEGYSGPGTRMTKRDRQQL